MWRGESTMAFIRMIKPSGRSVSPMSQKQHASREAKHSASVWFLTSNPFHPDITLLSPPYRQSCIEVLFDLLETPSRHANGGGGHARTSQKPGLHYCLLSSTCRRLRAKLNFAASVLSSRDVDDGARL